MNKVMVIGLDGATFDLIKPWVEEEKLAAFKKLMKDGVHGELKSSIPPLTAPAWASFTTGKNPRKHGIFGFCKIEDRKIKLVNLNDMTSKSIWDYLGEDGKYSGIVNLPLTYPPKAIKGFMISGMFTPSELHDFTYPKSLKKELPKGYIIEPVSTFERSKEKRLKILHDSLEKRIKLFWCLVKKKRWNLLVILFRETDIAQHFFWNEKQTIFEIYKKIDNFLSKVISECDDICLMVISDHGFQKTKGIFYMNTFLINNNFLVLKENVKPNLNSIKVKVHNFILKHNLFGLKAFIKKYFPRFVPKSELIESIDWNETKVLHKEYGLFINTKIKGKYKKIKNELIKKLMSLGLNITIHDSGVIGQPLFVEIEKWSYILRDEIEKKLFGSSIDETGTHAINGIFIAYGKNIKSEVNEIKGIRLIDLAPTIMYILGTPIPKDMDGKVFKKILKQ